MALIYVQSASEFWQAGARASERASLAGKLVFLRAAARLNLARAPTPVSCGGSQEGGDCQTTTTTSGQHVRRPAPNAPRPRCRRRHLASLLCRCLLVRSPEPGTCSTERWLLVAVGLLEGSINWRATCATKFIHFMQKLMQQQQMFLRPS